MLFRTFNQFWEGMSDHRKINMNKADVEFGWLASAANLNDARLLGRRNALRELFNEFQRHDYFHEAKLVNSFYKTDISFSGKDFLEEKNV